VIRSCTTRLPRAILALALQLWATLCFGASGHKGWSLDLKDYGYKEWRDSKGPFQESRSALVVSGGVVGVALANPSSNSQPDVPRDHANWDVSLLFFDAATGKLNAKAGPWPADRFFDLFPASQGNFLLLLRHFNQGLKESSETLLLLSPKGDELKELALGKTSNRVLVSPSGHTILIQQTIGDGVHCQLLNADTFVVQSECADERAPDSPAIVALSDKEFLGSLRRKDSQTAKAPEKGSEIYVRPFAGAWSALPVSLNTAQRGFPLGLNFSQLAFLSDDTLVGIDANRETSEAQVVALRADGAAMSTPAIPKLEANTVLAGPVRVSQDGRYFAIGFSHRPWLSHLMLDVWKLDDTFSPDELVLVVWASGVPTAVAKFNMGTDFHAREFSFALDDPPSLVFLGRSTVKAIPIQRLR